MKVGVIPASKTTEEEETGWDIGYFFYDGIVFGRGGNEVESKSVTRRTKVGNLITVTLNLDERAVAFETNDAEVASVSVADEPHFFAFEAPDGEGKYANATVTITEFVM